MPLTRIKNKGLGNSVSRVNIVDTGTEGTKVAAGTTAQRGSTTGQWRYNTTTGKFEGRVASEFIALEPTPTVASVDVTDVDPTAGGTQTFVITGTNFSSGGTITFVGSDGTEVNANSTTFNSSTQVTAVEEKATFTNAKEPWKIKFTSASNTSATSTGLIYSDQSPAWSTAAGNVGNVLEGAAISPAIQLSATDPDGDSITYSETTSALSGAGFSLSSSGAITGTAQTVSGDTTTTFTVRATANGKTADRSFNIITKNLNTNALLWDASNLVGNSTYDMPNANGLGLTNAGGTTLSPTVAVQFTNVRGSAGTMAHGYLVTDKQDTWGHYTHNDGRDSTIGDTFWSTTLQSGHSQGRYSSWFGSHNGGSYGNSDMWFAMDYGDNPSFRINRLTGYSEWRTATANMTFYGTNDISNLNGNTGNTDAGSMTTTGLTALKSNFNIQSTSWDTSTFTNNTFYRYYIIRVVASGSPYDWGLQRIKYYGDYY